MEKKYQGFSLENFKELKLMRCQPIIYEHDGMQSVGFFVGVEVEPSENRGVKCTSFPCMAVCRRLYHDHQTEYIPLKETFSITPLMALDGRITITLEDLLKIGRK